MIYLFFLLLGIATAGYFNDIVSLIIIGVSVLCLFIIKRKEYSIKKVIVLLLIMAVGFSYYTIFDFIVGNKYNDVNLKNTDLTITVLSEPDYTYNTLRFEGKVDEYNKKATITLYDTPHFSQYDKLKLKGSIYSITNDKERYYSNSIYYKVISYDKNITITRGSGFLKAVADFKKNVLFTIDAVFSNKTAMFLKGVLVGDEKLRSAEFKDALMKLSLSHIVSVSGMHFSIITAFVLYILRRLYIKRKYTSLITIPFSLLLAIFIGFTPSVVRVLITITILSLADLFDRDRVNDTYLLLFVAILMILFNVYYIHSVAFILSFTSLTGILIYTKRIEGVLSKLPKFLTKVIPVTLSASIITLPFVLYYFKGLPTLSLIANIITVPLLSFVMIYGIIVIGISMLWMPLGQLIAFPVNLISECLLFIITYLSNLEFSYIKTLTIEKYHICLYLSALFVFFLKFKKINKIIIASFMLFVFFINIFYPLDSVLSPGATVYTACGEDSGKVIVEYKGKTVYINSSAVNKKSLYDIHEKYNNKFDVYVAFEESGVKYFIDNNLYAERIYIPLIFCEEDYFTDRLSLKCKELLPVTDEENITNGYLNLTLKPKDEYNIYNAEIYVKNKKILIPGETPALLDNNSLYVLKYYSLDAYKDSDNVLNCFENEVERIKL